MLTQLAGLLFTVGCHEDKLEQEGDPEPKQAEYRVSVTPNKVDWEIKPQVTKFSTIVNLDVRCNGPRLPPGCDSHAPNWMEYGGQPLSVTIDVPAKPQTFATVELLVSDLPKEGPNSLLGGGKLSYFIDFSPRNVPADLRLAGNRTFAVNLTFPTPASDRQEQPANKPRLTPIPPPLLVQFQTQVAEVAYSGPDNDLLMSKTGPDAARFAVDNFSGVTGPPYAVTDGNTVSVLVTFLGAIDSKIYTATLTFTPLNGGKPAVIVLKGQQR